jgi:hypothetical protein
MLSRCFTHENCRIRYGVGPDGHGWTVHEPTLGGLNMEDTVNIKESCAGNKERAIEQDYHYKWLRTLFEDIEKELSREKQVELDGLLWDLARELSQ